ncbi:MAG: RsmB/NOP family class I SAM-dependent RNA methyltransferase [Alphaproteobacteria bacterium]
MQPSGHIQSCIELLSEFKGQSAPFKRFHKSFFKSRRYAGSKDRRAIFHMAMQIFRHYYNLNRMINACGLDINERSLVIAYLYLVENKDINDLKLLFVPPYGPKPLSINEQQALSMLSHKEAIEYSLELPDFILPSMIKQQGEVILSCFAHMAQNILKPYFRINPHKGEYFDICEQLIADDMPIILPDEDDDITLRPLPYLIQTFGQETIDIRNHPLYQQGLIEIQDKGSQILCSFIPNKPQQILWDFCGGAGGKSLYLQSASTELKVILSDITAVKLKEAQKRFTRAGLKIPQTLLLPQDLPKPQDLKADILLLDVPCSGSGTWQRNADLKVRLSQQSLTEIIQTQQKIIDQSIPYLKAGGQLYYMTCSLFAEENEEQVKYILKNHPKMAIKSICDINPYAHDLKQRAKSKGYVKEENSPFLKIYPNVENCDGFFLAILEKEK